MILLRVSAPDLPFTLRLSTLLLLISALTRYRGVVFAVQSAEDKKKRKSVKDRHVQEGDMVGEWDGMLSVDIWDRKVDKMQPEHFQAIVLPADYGIRARADPRESEPERKEGGQNRGPQKTTSST